MNTHGLLAVEQRMRHSSHLTEDHTRNWPRPAHLLQHADIHSDVLLDDVVLAVGDEEGPV